MTNRVYFDQQVIQNNFASFTSNELFENKSIFSLIFSIFTKEEDQDALSWNSAFSFAYDRSGSFGVICVGYNIFLIDFKTNKIKNNIIPNTNSDTYIQSTVAISTESIAVLCNSYIYFYTHELVQQKDPIQLSKNMKAKKIFCISNNFYIITISNSLIKVPTLETTLSTIKSNYTISSSSNSRIALVGKKTMTIITNNMTTITPNSDFLNHPQDCTFSTNGNLFFILDRNKPNSPSKNEDTTQLSEITSNLYILDVTNGFKLTDTIEIQDGNIRYLSSWVNNHVVVYDDFGSLFFVTLSSQDSSISIIVSLCIIQISGLNQ